jgi:hypothetical protein
MLFLSILLSISLSLDYYPINYHFTIYPASLILLLQRYFVSYVSAQHCKNAAVGTFFSHRLRYRITPANHKLTRLYLKLSLNYHCDQKYITDRRRAAKLTIQTSISRLSLLHEYFLSPGHQVSHLSRNPLPIISIWPTVTQIHTKLYSISQTDNPKEFTLA